MSPMPEVRAATFLVKAARSSRAHQTAYYSMLSSSSSLSLSLFPERKKERRL